MHAETLVKLIEEMMDLKVQHYAESHLKPNPEVAKLLLEKRETDRRRLEQILERDFCSTRKPAF